MARLLRTPIDFHLFKMPYNIEKEPETWTTAVGKAMFTVML